MDQPGQLSERFQEDVLIFTHSVPKEGAEAPLVRGGCNSFRRVFRERERDWFGAAEVKLVAFGGRSSQTVEALSLASWEILATRRVRTLQAFLPSLSTCVPTVHAALRR